MSTQEVTFNLEGRVIAAQLLEPDSDTSGHAGWRPSEIEVDVEGHAMTLRLPNAADAEAIKRALAVGAITVALAGGGIVAVAMSQPQAPAAPDGNSITVPVSDPAQNVPPVRSTRAEAE